MAIKGLHTVIEGIDQIDTAKRFALGSYHFLGDATYVYVQGVTSGAAGKHVTFTSAGVTTLSVANAKGPVGILMSALDATTKYGFAQVFGINAIADVTALTAGAAAYLTATGGRLDETDVAGDQVHNYVGIVTGASNVATVFLNYPYVTDVALD